MKLVSDWKQSWKFYSVWALAVIAALPDLYNLLAAAGLFDQMPEPAKWAVRGGAVLALVGRFVRQKKPQGDGPTSEET
jgi:hypothetical protein